MFGDVTSDSTLESFPVLKGTYDRIKEGEKCKLQKADLDTMRGFFNGDESVFKKYLATLVINYHSNNLTMVSVTPYLTRINRILRQIGSQIDLNGRYRKIIISRNCGEIGINESAPPLVFDYMHEGITCLENKLYRSSIVLCIFAIECALRVKYNLVTSKHSDNLKFNKLINWAIDQKIIESDQFNEPNITFMRRYRNSLAHTDGGKITEQDAKDSRENAAKKSQIISRLAELFINNIFP